MVLSRAPLLRWPLLASIGLSAACTTPRQEEFRAQRQNDPSLRFPEEEAQGELYPGPLVQAMNLAARDFLPEKPGPIQNEMERCLASPEALDYVVYKGEVPAAADQADAGVADTGPGIPAYFISVRRNWDRCSDGGVFGATHDYARYVFTQDGVLLRVLGPGEE